jgi:hypothetical protein
VISGLQAAYAPEGSQHDFPAAPYFVFGSVALLFAAGDIRMLVRGGVSGPKRIVRHLSRMSIAFFIAAASFFLGQQKVMPAYMRIEATVPAASPNPNSVDLLAGSHVVQKDDQPQTGCRQAGSCPVITSTGFLGSVWCDGTIPIFVRALS